MPNTRDTKQANHLSARSSARRRWFVPALVTVFLVLLVIVFATIILFSRRQPLITKKIPAGVTENQKEKPASLLKESIIFRAKIPPGSTNPTESPSKQTQLAKNQTQSTVPAENVKAMPAKTVATMPAVPVDQQNSKPASAAPEPQPETTATLAQPLQKKPTLKDTEASQEISRGEKRPIRQTCNKSQKIGSNQHL